MGPLTEKNPTIREAGNNNVRQKAMSTLRVSMLLLGMFALMAAVWGGLVRIGWHFFELRPGLPGVHGPLVVCGFLGTLFSLERAISLRRVEGYLVPFLIGLGSMVLFIDPSSRLSPFLVTAGSVGFLVICLANLWLKFNLFTSLITMGSLIWLAGICIWLARWPVFNVYLWWMSFVLFTLVGQRLELAQRIRLTAPPLKYLAFFVGIVLFGQILMAVGHIMSPDNMDIYIDAIVDPRLKLGMRVAGIGTILTALWLLKYDAAWSTMKNGGVAGYSATCLISGTLWLGVSGLLSFFFAGLVSGVRYDALLHAFFVGFVFFVVFAHGPIIFVSSLGLRFPNVKILLAEAFLLHVTLALRVGGDLFRCSPAKKIGGLSNALVITAFLLTLIFWFVRSVLPFSKWDGTKTIFFKKGISRDSNREGSGGDPL
ncbi:MAG: hypothetical protein LHV69_06235 [Elusimicrobia bacterium]|nr:hypothetical protein [Candidatus Obscuribacterium magneticum]